MSQLAQVEVSVERASSGVAVWLRPMEPTDELLIFDWQWEPGARSHSRNPKPPSREEHAAWMAGKLADPSCCAMVVMEDGRPAGVLRLDRLREEGLEVSILIEQRSRGKGIGSAALRAANRLVPHLRLVAEIYPENTASLRAFAGAGFEPCGGTWYARSKVDHPPAGD
ncbi:MAG TPA: GNAT family N-acetyltransferase [Hyphomicrobiaceae bacterium]|nr:GNAT family N-acetyltransferase [Hyphomicrobiaceae bacterium]